MTPMLFLLVFTLRVAIWVITLMTMFLVGSGMGMVVPSYFGRKRSRAVMASLGCVFAATTIPLLQLFDGLVFS